MKNVENYLTEYIDEEAKVKACDKQIIDKLNLLLISAFDYYEMSIMNTTALLLRPREKQTIHRLVSWMTQVAEVCETKTVLLIDNPTPYITKKLLRERIAFIVPGKQISLPFLIMTIKTEKPKTHKSIVKFSPATQMIFLHILYSDEEMFSIDDTAVNLDLSKMSVQRGLTELEELGLLTHEIGGMTGRKKLFKSINKEDYYAEGKQYLNNPVRRTVYVQELPDGVKLMSSDISALAEQTMLGEPERKHYALYSKEEKRIENFAVPQEEAIEENLPEVQLMKYDVSKLSSNDFVDPVSVIYSLSDNDERIGFAVEELMAEYDWYKGEGE